MEQYVGKVQRKSMLSTVGGFHTISTAALQEIIGVRPIEEMMIEERTYLGKLGYDDLEEGRKKNTKPSSIKIVVE